MKRGKINPTQIQSSTEKLGNLSSLNKGNNNASSELFSLNKPKIRSSVENLKMHSGKNSQTCNYYASNQPLDTLGQEMEQENQMLKVENDHLRDKVKELENWLMLLLKNFYEGNPDQLNNIENVKKKLINFSQQGLKKIDDLRAEKFSLKKSLLLELKRSRDLEIQYLDLAKQSKQREEEIKLAYTTGDLLIQKSQLELTLKALSEEVECLSQKNEKLLRDLNTRDFYEQYHNACVELEKLRESHIALINTVDAHQLNTKDKQKTSRRPLFSAFTQNKQSTLIKQLQRNLKKKEKDFESTQVEKQSLNSSFLSFLSCAGCSPGLSTFQVISKANRNQSQKQDDQFLEEYEAVLSKSDINFLSQMNYNHNVRDSNKDLSLKKPILRVKNSLQTTNAQSFAQSAGSTQKDGKFLKTERMNGCIKEML